MVNTVSRAPIHFTVLQLYRVTSMAAVSYFSACAAVLSVTSIALLFVDPDTCKIILVIKKTVFKKTQCLQIVKNFLVSNYL